jgi:hypothetical protein
VWADKKTLSIGSVCLQLGWSALLFLGACSTGVQKMDSEPGTEPVLPALTDPDIGQSDGKPAYPTADDLAAIRIAELACIRITVAATGDIMLGTDFPEDHLPDDDAIGFLTDVTPVFKSADIAFGNLEGVLMDGGEPGKKCKNPDLCYLFRSPERYAERLAAAGFTVMSLANNHARDFGEEGRTASMDALRAAGIKHSGREGDIATWSHGEVGAALIAFAPFRNSNSMLDIEPATQLVQTLSESFDIVIVSFHGGAEGMGTDRIPFSVEYYYGEDRGDVVKFSRRMVDAGADLVIGHGPHVPRAMEIYRNRLIAYSLGNFATYYGISVKDEKGYAPILVSTLDGNGQFVSGEIVSAIQIRPDGPTLDDQQRAYQKIWELTEQDFSGGGIQFQKGGGFLPDKDPEILCQQPPATEM